MAVLRGREEAVYLDKAPSIPFQLIGEVSDELSPADGSDRFRKMTVLHHALNVEVLADGYGTGIRYLSRELVLEIPPLVGGLLLFPADLLSTEKLTVPFVLKDRRGVMIDEYNVNYLRLKAQASKRTRALG